MLHLKRVVIAILLLMVFAACMGTEDAGEVDRELQESLRLKAELFEKARKLIANGTPASMQEGLEILSSQQLQGTERGAELSFAAKGIYRVVYPYLGDPDLSPSLPSASIYDELMEQVEAGIYPEVKSEEADFMTLLLSSLAYLTTDEQEQAERAEDAVLQLVEVNPDSLLARYLRGEVYRRNGNFEEALEIFLYIAEQDSSCYPALLEAARMDERRGRSWEVLPYVEILLKRFPDKIDVLQVAVDVLISAGRYGTADTVLSRAIAHFSENRDFLLSRMLLLERLGDTQKALRLVRAFERGYGSRAQTLLARGRAALGFGRLQEAEELAEQGRRVYPGVYEFTLLYTNVLRRTGRNGEAYEALQTKWNASPWNMELLSSLLDMAIELEKWQEGRKYLQNLLSYDPDAYGTLRKAVSLYRGSGNTSAALEYAGKMIELYPGRTTSISVYAELLIEAGEREELRSYIEKTLEVTDSAEIRSLLYYYRSEIEADVEAKISSLQSALFENMQNIRALVRIAELYERRGETAKAVRYLQQAVAARPGDEDLRRRLGRLEEQME